jgi:serine/threonine protein phosphatase PrpC
MNRYKSFAVTVPGGSHIKHGKGCEDASFCKEDNSVCIAVVADGHGDDNCFRSSTGSKLAVSCAANGIQEFLKIHEQTFKKRFFSGKPVVTHNEFEKTLKETLLKYTIASWHKNIADNYETNPFTPEELEKADDKHRKRYEAKQDINKAYGTTLIASAITPYYWFGVHIGDGRLTALYPDGSFDQPVPWDDKCYLNVTTSICDEDAYTQARCYISLNSEKPPPLAVFLCSDGLDDNYPVEENKKHLYKLYRTIALTFAEDGFESTFKQLKDLAEQYATKGKGDDTSIAGFIDMEAVKKAVPVWKKQITEEEKPVSKEPKEPTEAKPAEEKTQDTVINVSAKKTILGYGNFILPKKQTEKNKGEKL